MTLEYSKHEKISLCDDTRFNEAWLQERISEDPSMIGFGAVELLERERRQKKGRLDLLLSDPGRNTRYEVELQLGATDPDHIIRCLEYWDIERRRYPAYEHVAVLVAEDVTTRFLNIMSLFDGTIPFVALQLEALQVDEKIILSFVKVLDQRSLRRDDETDVVEGKETTRAEWVEYCGEKIMGMVDRVLLFINKKATPKRTLKYRQQHVGLTDGRRVSNFIWFEPRKSFLHIVYPSTPDAHAWSERLEEAGLPAEAETGWLKVTVRPEEFAAHEELIRELTLAVVEESQA